MEGNYYDDNLLALVPFNENTSFAPPVAENYNNQQYIIERGGGVNYDHPFPLQECIDYEQMAHNYVEYLSEHVAYDVQQELTHTHSGVASCHTTVESFSDMGVPKKQEPTEGNCRTCQNQLKLNIPISGNKSRKRTNERSLAADRRRRTRIAQALDALHGLLPQSKQDSKEDLVDDVVDYVKFLQFQLKELSQNRLAGESTSVPLTFLEGQGHYFFNGTMPNGPLEELIGRWLCVNPYGATQMLERRGLLLMPMDLAEGLH